MVGSLIGGPGLYQQVEMNRGTPYPPPRGMVELIEPPLHNFSPIFAIAGTPTFSCEWFREEAACELVDDRCRPGFAGT
jgi:hypothetical protein